MAPELLLSNSNRAYSSKADLWSLGVCFYHMLYGVMPFEAKTYEALKNKVRLYSGDNTKFPSNIHVSKQSKDLIISLLQIDPDKRIGWNEFFNHPIFKENS